MSKMTGDWTKLQAKLNDISKGKVKDDMEEQLQDSANDLEEAAVEKAAVVSNTEERKSDE